MILMQAPTYQYLVLSPVSLGVDSLNGNTVSHAGGNLFELLPSLSNLEVKNKRIRYSFKQELA
jgi:hypothetical protein